MSKKIYIIRKIAFHYSDEYNYEATIGALVDTYDTEEEANKALDRLEIPEFRRLNFGDIEQTSFSKNYLDAKWKLDAYFKRILPESPFHYTKNGENLYIPYGFTLPKEVTDKQILEIRRISMIRFYELSVFEDEVVFYAIWLNHKKEFMQIGDPRYGTSIYFFNSYQDATDSLENHLHRFEDLRFKGTLEDLSSQPSLLNTVIESSIGINYQNEVLSFNYNLSHQDFISINALFKEPMYEIRPFSLEDAKKIPHVPFEIM